MEAITYREALELASEPRSRFFFGSPCRFVARVDSTMELAGTQPRMEHGMTDNGEDVAPPYHVEDDQIDPPPDYDALLADRDGWKRLADERWQIIARLQAESGRDGA